MRINLSARIPIRYVAPEKGGILTYRTISKYASATVAIVVASSASAQTVVRGQGVADRARPLYDELGARFGSFYLYPSVKARVEATDNLRATNTNRQSDIAVVLSPEVRLASNWSRHRLNARVYYDRDFHLQQTGENTNQYGAQADGALDVTRDTQFRANVSAARLSESRSSLGSFQNASQPVRYTSLDAGLSLSQRLQRLSLSAGVSYAARNFDDAIDFNGVRIDQRYRDVKVLAGSASAQYELRGGIGLIVSGQVDRSRYSFRPGSPGFNPAVNIDRASSGFSLLGGVSFELSSLVFGSVQVGVLSRTYKDTRLRNYSGLSYNANILWNVTPLTSIRARAQRVVEDTSSPTVAGNTRSDFSLGVDHELYRYVVLTADASYGRFTPNGPGVGGQEYGARLAARYLIDRRWSLGAEVRHARRTSDSPFLRYEATSGSISVRFAL